MKGLRYAKMSARYLQDVLRLDRYCHEQPWGEKDYYKVSHAANAGERVVIQNGFVVGYFAWIRQKDYVEIIRFMVDTTQQRQGFGRAMMEKLIYLSVSPKRRILVLQISEAQPTAVRFLSKFGFMADDLIRHHDKPDDLVMRFLCHPEMEAYTKLKSSKLWSVL